MKRFAWQAIVLFYIAIGFFSCTNTTLEAIDNVAETSKIANFQESTQPPEIHTEPTRQISLCFAGDIMAHKPNYIMKDFDLIWKDVVDVFEQTDFCFANIEAPVADSKPYSTYPNFNMHSDYINAAIKAGLNVFSLANNHTNDQGLEGIYETRTFFENLQVASCGLKKTSDAAMSYCIIKKNDVKIIFLAVTALLNSKTATAWINYSQPGNAGEIELVNYIKQLRAKHDCDCFILSYHSAEPEYIKDITPRQRAFYQRLLSAGIDIVWANHPHIVRPWELYEDANGKITKIIMYGMGNTISAQRFAPDFKTATQGRDDTGDGVLLKLQASVSKDGVEFSEIVPIYITTYIDEKRNFIIKKLNSETIIWLTQNGQVQWANYLEARKQITTKIKGSILKL